MRRTVMLGAALAAAVLASPVEGFQRRDAEAAFRGVQQGEILPLHVIRERVRVAGAVLIGVDLVGGVYRLRFMRGPNVIMVDVDARTGRPIGCMGC